MRRTNWLIAASIGLLAACGSDPELPFDLTDIPLPDVGAGDAGVGDDTTPDEDVTPDEDTGEDTTPDDVTPDDTTPDDVTPDDTTPDDTTPDDTTPDDVTPDDTTPDDVTPDDTTPDDTTPDDVTDDTSTDTMPGDVMDDTSTDATMDATTDTTTDTTPDDVAPDADPCADIVQCDPGDGTPVCEGDTLVSCTADASGCFVETAEDCTVGGGTCNADLAACERAPGICSLAGTLNCDSGTITSDTAAGTEDHTAFADCGNAFTYPGLGEVWEFTAASRAEVQIISTRLTTTADMDLYVMDGAFGCSQDGGCLDSSTGTAATETVNFVAEAGSPAYVFFDAYTSAPAGTTVEYTLDISCIPLVCGDGVTSGDESCDDGNDVDGDGCASTCEIEPGFVCEEDDAALSTCREITCGDGRIDGDEECDAGGPSEGCSETCQVETGFDCEGEPSICVPVCGNGVVDDSEDCDPADLHSGPGCDLDCTLLEGAVCDDPFVTAAGFVRCYFPGCGDGLLSDLETCDFGSEPGLCSEDCFIDETAALIGAVAYPAACVVDGDLQDLPECVASLPIGATFVQGSLGDADALFDRRGSCAGTAGAADHFADAYTFRNDQDVPVDVQVSATWSADGYLFVFDGDAALDNYDACLALDDDFGGTAASWIETTLTVAPGASITVIATTFAEGVSIADYTVTIHAWPQFDLP
jgi:cysteine-rich repeat protein